MKKAYSKPDIFFESFKLSSSIANTCEGEKGNSASMETCSFEYNGYEIFLSTEQGCLLFNCYDGPQNDSTIFGS